MDTAPQKSGGASAGRRKFHLSFLELLILVAIAAILASLLVPMFNQPDRLGPVGNTRARMMRLKRLMLSYQLENHRWPETEKWTSQLEVYVAKGNFSSLKDLTNDGWHNPILFELRTNNNETNAYFRSFGRNGRDDHSKPDDIVVEVTDSGR